MFCGILLEMSRQHFLSPLSHGISFGFAPPDRRRISDRL
jgi:hypothetical protein